METFKCKKCNEELDIEHKASDRTWCKPCVARKRRQDRLDKGITKVSMANKYDVANRLMDTIMSLPGVKHDVDTNGLEIQIICKKTKNTP